MSKKYAINTIKHPSIWEGLVRLPLLLLLLSFSVSISAQNADKIYKEAKELYDAKNYMKLRKRFGFGLTNLFTF